ncbi:nucleoside triphosphate pyrophosphohydrolase family protein [Candidatus Saccharibacteria bacterium]|nr:nucleoside triphosphate pyrophosphohydrolase family protein [Candidatus Saccharibacteria bacterium]
MNFTEYQQLALKTANPKTNKNELFHLVLGLVGEAGEIAEKMKKLVRDKDSDEAQIDRDGIKKELGDVLWYIAVTASYLDIDLDDLAVANINKLADRQARGVLSGSGDNR